MHKAVLASVGSSVRSIPGIPVPQRRAYSLDSLSSGAGQPSLGSFPQQPHAERASSSLALTQRNLSAVAVQGQRRPLCRFDFLDIGEVEENIRRAKACKKIRRFIVDPDLAQLIAQHLDPEDAKTVILEFNPGPGVLTKTLLNAGAQRVVALEGDKSLLKDLQELEACLDGQLEVVHCDLLKLDPISFGEVKPPAMFTDKLFTDLGISETSWTDDVPVKVVGILPQRNQRSFLLKMAYALFERSSFYRYGRVELNLLIDEKEYQKMVTGPGNWKHYVAFSVLWQMSCDIELLHKVPWESFAMSSKPSVPLPKASLPNDHMCLVRLRPKADLFSSGLSPSNAQTLFVMVRQCLAKRKTKLIDILNVWSPDSGSKLLEELGLPENILTGNVYPEEYLRLFRMINKSEDFAQSWLYGEVLENVGDTLWGNHGQRRL